MSVEVKQKVFKSLLTTYHPLKLSYELFTCELEIQARFIHVVMDKQKLRPGFPMPLGKQAIIFLSILSRHEENI